MSADPSSPARQRDAPTFSAGPTDPVGECAALVRRHDRDRYLAALTAPRESRAALVALYAFNLEIARVRETASEPILGRIRLQWWRETLDAICNGGPVRQHAVALALAEAIRRGGLDRAALGRMIEGREFDLEDRQPATLDALVAYADATSGTLAVLAMTTLGVHGEGAQLAAREAGIAWALAGLLRAVPFHAAQRRVYLPRNEIDDDAALRQLFAGRSDDRLARAVAVVAERARGHLATARAHRYTVPRAGLAALLPSVLIEGDLAELERARFDAFAARGGTPIARQARLMWAALCGRY